MSAEQKSPTDLQPGDVVVPTRGRYQGMQCEVQRVELARFSTYNVIVVPVIPTPDAWSVDYTDRIPVLASPSGEATG